MVRLLTLTLGALAVLFAGCASMQNTPQQDYTFAMGENCYSTLQLPSGLRVNKVDADGSRWWTNPVLGGTHDIGALRACMQEQFRAHPYKAWLAANQKPTQTQAKGDESAGRKTASPSVSVAAASTPATWKPGDEWSYRWESPRGKGTFVWAVDREEVLDGTAFYVVKSGGTREIYYRKSDFAYYMDKVDGQVETRHTPPTAYFPWPPAPGAKLELRYTRERPLERQTEEMALACESGASEPVTVPAGTFDAVKVTCRNSRTNAVSVEMWLSPAVKHMVRERTHFSYGVRERELTSFTLKQ
jgi:hypothetical protein